MLSVIYAQFRVIHCYAECHSGECRLAECLGTIIKKLSFNAIVFEIRAEFFLQKLPSIISRILHNIMWPVL
jgi:hypothetical protein